MWRAPASRGTDLNGDLKRREALFVAGLFRGPAKQDPLITQLKLVKNWQPMLEKLEKFGDDCIKLIYKGDQNLDEYLFDLLTGINGPTKIHVLTKLRPGLLAPVIDALKAKYQLPLTNTQQEQLYDFYDQEPGILPLIVSAVGQETVDAFVKAKNPGPA